MGRRESLAKTIGRDLRAGKRIKQDCGKCGTSGWMGGSQSCDACGGKGFTAIPAALSGSDPRG